MVDLLELAQRVRVELPLPREQVKLLEQPLGLMGQQLPADVLRLDLPPQSETTSTSSGIASRSRLSIPIFSVMVEDGQPLHEPFMCM